MSCWIQTSASKLQLPVLAVVVWSMSYCTCAQPTCMVIIDLVLLCINYHNTISTINIIGVSILSHNSTLMLPCPRRTLPLTLLTLLLPWLACCSDWPGNVLNGFGLLLGARFPRDMHCFSHFINTLLIHSRDHVHVPTCRVWMNPSALPNVP